MKRAPSVIAPGPEGTYPFNYALLVQPVLDEHCVRCHDGSKGAGKSGLVLSGEAEGEFTRSYNGLKPFVRWYEWGGATISEIVTRPGRIGADVSALSKVLVDDTHSKCVELSEAEMGRINIWLDGNVPFYGTYDEEAQKAQRMAKKVGAPALQ